MIKIIKEGKIDKYEHTCEYCGCVYTYEYEDINYRNGNSLTTNPHVICPYCHKMNFVQYYAIDWTKKDYNPSIIYCDAKGDVKW